MFHYRIERGVYVNVPVLTHGFLHLTTTTVRSLTPARSQKQQQTDYILGDQ